MSEEIIKNEVLTPDEISDILANIELAQDDLEADQQDAEDERLQFEFDCDDLKENSEAKVTEQVQEPEPESEPESEPKTKSKRFNFWEYTPEELAEKKRLYAIKRKEDSNKIQARAFNQNAITLTDRMTETDMRELVTAASQKSRNLANHYKTYVNKRFGWALMTLIPGKIRRCFRKYPQVFKQAPGFFYTSDSEELADKTFFIQPIMPYYFEQGTEMEEYAKVDPQYTFGIDANILSYFRLQKKLSQQEVSIATTIRLKKISTYFDVLKHNPFWFDALYIKRTGTSLLNEKL